MCLRIQLAVVSALAALALSASPAAAIINGTTASSSSWPWAVQVLVVEDSNLVGSCGGTLVAPQRVVTAGSCTTFGDEILVLANTKKFVDPTGQYIQPTDIQRAPGFDPFTGTDVAVLTLEAAPDPAVPIEVLRPEESADFPVPASALVAGWGTTDPSSDLESETLQQAQVTLTNCPGEVGVRCSTRAGSDPGPCFGDLGAPAIVRLGADTVSKDPTPANGTWRLVALPLGGAMDCSEIVWVDLTQPAIRDFVEGKSQPEPPGTGGGASTTPTPPAAPAAVLPPRTKLLKARIDADKGKASFRFKASGSLSGFQCALTSTTRKKTKFRSCRSPKTYKNLAPGNYTFKVRATGPGGLDATPAKKRFTIR